MIVRIKARAQAASQDVVLDPIRLTVKTRPMRILDFDVEARPLHWISGDYVSKEITAIAWKFIDEPEECQCYLLGEAHPVVMLTEFCKAYDQADMVTGHFIRGYDLSMVNGALTEYQLPPLGKKLVQDTKVDLMKRAGLSGSQENLGTMLGLQHPKVHMDQKSWRDANRLTPEGLLRVRERVVGDVLQHIEMRAKLLELGYLGPPTMWESNSDASLTYTP